MKNSILGIFSLFFLTNTVKAQYEYSQMGEFGITAGAAHYFGDLNTRSAINRLKPAFGIYFLRQFNNYLGMRISGHFAQLGYSDTYSKNEYQQRRNLSFNSNIWEFAVHGDFNFFKFVPGDVTHSFTPYITIGVGVFSFNPYAYLEDRKVFLRPLGTEGQNIPYKDANGKTRKPYNTVAVCFPLGGGIKYNINNKVNLSFQVAHRLTLTDYLDDVSTTYVGSANFPTLPNGKASDAALLQDRSYETGTSIGLEGRQRGWNKQKDQYLIAEIGLSFNIASKYKCPSGN